MYFDIMFLQITTEVKYDEDFSASHQTPCHHTRSRVLHWVTWLNNWNVSWSIDYSLSGEVEQTEIPSEQTMRVSHARNFTGLLIMN